MSRLDAALGYAARGWPVFPIVANDKIPATPQGFKNATTKAEAIRVWFANYPDANLGLRTGGESNVFVLDVDPRHGGDKSFAALVAQHGPLPNTVSCTTPSGGTHYYFVYGTTKVRNRQSFLPGLDVRGQGGYVVLPPSVRDGLSYEWIEGCAPDQLPIAEAPSWLLDMIVAKPNKPKAKPPKAPRTTADALLKRAIKYLDACSGAEEGRRNAAAFSIAGNLRALVGKNGEQLDEQTLLALMSQWNARCSPPLEIDELKQCVDSSGRNGTPRDLKPIGALEAPGDGQTNFDGRQALTLWAGEMHKALDTSIGIIAVQKPPVMFVRARGPVRVIRSANVDLARAKRPGPHIQSLNDSGLCDAFNRLIRFQVEERNPITGEIKILARDCPTQLARWGLGGGDWSKLPPLNGVATLPQLRPSGGVIIRPGYDFETGLLLDVDDGEFPPIAEHPTEEDARRAYAEHICPLYEEFPFATRADRSAAISAVFTVVGRAAFGTAPLHGFTASTMASGKTLLADIPGMLVYGVQATPINFSQTAEEFEKRIHSELIDGAPLVPIDNVQRPLGGDELCTAITSLSLGIRVFKTQNRIKVPTCHTTFTATGNNLCFDKDLRSRAVLSRIDPKMERPEQREFKIPRLLPHVAQYRAKIVAAALTILRAFILAGKPRSGLKPLNRFEDWSDLIRGALVWLGEADPVETMDGLARSDDETQGLLAILHGVYAQFGAAEFTAAQVVANPQTELREVLDLVCRASSGDRLDPRRLGRFFQTNERRIVDGLRLELTNCAKGTNRYRVAVVGDPEGGRGGRGGSASPYVATDADACAHVHEPAPACERQELPHARWEEQLPPLQPLPPIQRAEVALAGSGSLFAGSDKPWEH